MQPDHVSFPCEVGDHDHCEGVVLLPEPVNGRFLTKCNCPDMHCTHPDVNPDKS